MGDDISTLWALVASVFVLISHAGIVGFVEGLTRKRSVTSGISRHLLSVAGSMVGVVACGFAVARGSGNDWFGTEGFALSDVDLAARIGPDGSPTYGALLLVQIAVSVAVSAGMLGALAERATAVAHFIVGFVVGGLALPVILRAIQQFGVLGAISVGEARFVDAAAASVFAMAGWFALVGTMIIGPRIGKFGSEGQPRAVPGKSLPMAVVGALMFFATAVGYHVVFEAAWSDELFTGAMALMIAGSAGAFSSAVVGYWLTGSIGGATVSRGLIAGVVSATGLSLETGAWRAIIVGAVGGVLALAVVSLVERAKVDDPVGSIACFGSAGVWGSLAVGLRGFEQFVAQLVGQLIVASWSIVVAGVVFGLLHSMRILRIPVELEMVGLDR